jgi:hypothetical protein
MMGSDCERLVITNLSQSDFDLGVRHFLKFWGCQILNIFSMNSKKFLKGTLLKSQELFYYSKAYRV